MSTVLAISCFPGPSAACLVREGAVVAAAEESWFTAVADERSFPQHAIAHCMERAGVEQVETVCYLGKPLKGFEHTIWRWMLDWPRTIARFPTELTAWLSRGLRVDATVRRELGAPIRYVDPMVAWAEVARRRAGVASATVVCAEARGTTAVIRLDDGARVQREMAAPHSLERLVTRLGQLAGVQGGRRLGDWLDHGIGAEPTVVGPLRAQLVDVFDDGSYAVHYRRAAAFMEQHGPSGPVLMASLAAVIAEVAQGLQRSAGDDALMVGSWFSSALVRQTIAGEPVGTLAGLAGAVRSLLGTPVDTSTAVDLDLDPIDFDAPHRVLWQRSPLDASVVSTLASGLGWYQPGLSVDLGWQIRRCVLRSTASHGAVPLRVADVAHDEPLRAVLQMAEQQGVAEVFATPLLSTDGVLAMSPSAAFRAAHPLEAIVLGADVVRRP